MMSKHLVYMFGKLAKAVEVLATNHHGIKERVWVASKYLFMLSPNAVPEFCREDVQWIHLMLTRYPAAGPYKSALEATYHRTRRSTAHKIAQRVWKLYQVMDTEVNVYLSGNTRT